MEAWRIDPRIMFADIIPRALAVVPSLQYAHLPREEVYYEQINNAFIMALTKFMVGLPCFCFASTGSCSGHCNSKPIWRGLRPLSSSTTLLVWRSLPRLVWKERIREIPSCSGAWRAVYQTSNCCTVWLHCPLQVRRGHLGAVRHDMSYTPRIDEPKTYAAPPKIHAELLAPGHILRKLLSIRC